MPTYEYKCENCGVFEQFQKITEDSLEICPKCGGKVSRLISASAFHLKGSGWYKTDYSSSSSAAPKSDEAAAPAATDASTPAAATETKTKTPESSSPAPTTNSTTESKQ